MIILAERIIDRHPLTNRIKPRTQGDCAGARDKTSIRCLFNFPKPLGKLINTL